MSFVRNQENFICEHCGTSVTGNGYTNHCPRCLWSKHVDIDPGDRLEKCGGMMEPVRSEGTTDDYRVVHRCERCGFERRQRVAADDSIDTLVALSGK